MSNEKMDFSLLTVDEMYRTLFEGAQDGIGIADAETGILLECNNALAKLVEREKSEIIGQPQSILHPSEDVDGGFSKFFLTQREAKERKNIETRVITKTGEIKYVQISANTVEFDGHKLVQGIFHDITERKHLEESLEENREKYRRLSEAAFEAIFISENGVCLEQNTAARKMFGYSDKEAVGRLCTEWVVLEDRELVKQNMLTGYEEPYEITAQRKDDSTFPVRVQAKMIQYQGRSVRVTSLRDITQRKQAEDELRLLSAITTNMAEGVILIKVSDGSIVYTNPKFGKMFGYDQGELVGKDIAMVNAPTEKSPEETAEEIKRSLRENGAWSGEVLNIKKDGTPFWCRANVSTLEHSQYGQIWVSVHTDITDRKQVEDALRQSEERNRKILETSADGFWLVDNNGKLLEVNNAYCQMSGYSREELLQMRVSDLDAKETPQAAAQHIQKVINEEEDRFETVHRRKDGRLFHVDVSVRFISNDGGKLFGFFRDITEKKRVEETLRRRAEEMTALQETVLGITSSTSLPELLQSITERATSLLGASSGGLYLTEPENKRVRCVVSYKTAKDFTGTTLAYGEGAAGHVAQTGESLLIDDYRKWSGKADVFEDEQSFQAIISAPMIWQGEVLGVIHMLREGKRGIFIQEELELLTQFADHAAVAVQNARLYESLQASEKRYRNIYERVDDIIYETDFHGHITGISPSTEKHTGYWPEELIGKDVVSFFDNPDEYRALLAEMEPTGTINDFEIRLRKKSGEVTDVSVTAHTVFDTDGNPIKTEGILRDITGRKRAEKMLRESEARFRNLVENAPEAVMVLNVESGKFESFNPKAFQLFKLRGEELLEKGPFNMSPPVQPDGRLSNESILEKIKLALDFQPQHYEWIHRDANGKDISCEVYLTRLPSSEKALLRISIVDITKRKQSEEQLRKLSRAVEAAPVSVVITDKEGDIEYINPIFSDLSGYEEDEVLGKNPRVLQSGKTPPETYHQLWDTILSGRNWQGEFINKRKGGELYIESAHISPVFDARNNITHFVAVKMDVTERVQMERALRESEERWQFALEGSGDGVWDWNAQTNRVFFSKQWKAMLGFEENEIGDALDEWDKRIHPDDRDFVYAEIEKHFSRQSPIYSSEHRVRCKDGSYKWIFDRGKVIRWTENGKPLRVIGTHTDITERKEMEQKLKESEERFHTLFEDSADAYLILDENIFVDCNQATIEMLRANSKEEILSKHPSELSPEFQPDGMSSVEKAGEMIRIALENGSNRFEWTHRRMDGEDFPVEVLLTPISVGSKTIVHTVWRDITERKQADEREREQRALAEALRDTAEALNSSLELDEILTKILDKVGDVVKYDTIGVAWINEHKMHFMKLQGFEVDQEQWIQKQSFNVDDFRIIQQVIENKVSCVVSNTKSDPRWISLPATSWIQSHIEAPVVVGGKVVAIINLDSKEPGFYTTTHAKSLQAFANQVAIAVQNAMLFEEVQNLATVDELTGLYNRRGFFEICRREVGRLQRFGRSFSALFFDIDHFKQFNDRYSYQVGDLVLQLVAETLQRNVREIDVVGRYGGEEMVALLPEINQTGAKEIAERLRKVIENLRAPSEHGELGITVSVGVATLIPVQGQTIAADAQRQAKILDDLIAKAGEALHIAKQQGRNRVVAI